MLLFMQGIICKIKLWCAYQKLNKHAKDGKNTSKLLNIVMLFIYDQVFFLTDEK